MATPTNRADRTSPPGMDDWRLLVEKSAPGRIDRLSSRTRDGIPISPLGAPRKDTAPIAARSGAWTLLQVVDHPDPAAASEQVQADLHGGARGLALRFAGAPTASGCGLPVSEEALDEVLEGVALESIQLRIEPHPRSHEIAGWLVDLFERRLPKPEIAAVSFGLDPIGVAAFQGTGSDAALTLLPKLLEAIRGARTSGTAIEADGRIYHEAGATDAQELAAVLATAVDYLRSLEHAGVGPAEALPLIGASLSADADQFVTIAKLRAMRLLWSRLAELCGVSDALRLHAETSRRMLAAADPHTNLLRTTIATLAAGVAGADSIAVSPFDEPLALPDRFSRRLARNTQLLLMEESDVHRVADPAAGSGGIEAITDALCERAWGDFQAIEREGGILASLASGALQDRIAAAREDLRRAVESGAAPIVGTTIYPAPKASPPGPNGPDTPSGGLHPIRLDVFARTGGPA